MTKSEFEELQVRAASCGTTLKEFLHVEGVAGKTGADWDSAPEQTGTVRRSRLGHF